MRNSFLPIVLLILLASFNGSTFKEDQLKYPRVRQAYSEKEIRVVDLLKTHSIDITKLRIYLRAFKKEKKIELWGKSESDPNYKLITTYQVCQTSGTLGPKRKQGDFQIPEGFYHINIFNPHSNFHLSLGLNYPNKSDRILGTQGNLGGDIFIHGNCVTIGCLPITDNLIKELYVLCVEAKNNGQNKIPVTVFPMELTPSNFNALKENYGNEYDKIGLWTDLKKGFDIFNTTKQLPEIGFLNNGRHNIKEN